MARDGRRTAVLLDEHPLWLDAVEGVVKASGVDVVAKATDCDTALALIEEHEPDLLVTEIVLPHRDLAGIDCIRRALELAPDLKAVVLSVRRDAYAIREAVGAGAVAYVVKTAQREDFASAIRQAFEHSVYLAGGLALAMISPRPEGDTRDEARPRTDDLTPREREILQLVAEGDSNAEVAKKLWVTEQTVKVHLSKIYRKLGVSNRTEASRWAQLNGLLEMEVGP